MLCEQVFVERSGIDTDADRNRAVFRLAGDRPDLIGLSDVAWIQPEPIDSGLERSQRQAILEVNVGNDRDG